MNALRHTRKQLVLLGDRVAALPFVPILRSHARVILLIAWPFYGAASQLLGLPGVFLWASLLSAVVYLFIAVVWALRLRFLLPRHSLAVALTLWGSPLIGAMLAYLMAVHEFGPGVVGKHPTWLLLGLGESLPLAAAVAAAGVGSLLAWGEHGELMAEYYGPKRLSFSIRERIARVTLAGSLPTLALLVFGAGSLLGAARGTAGVLALVASISVGHAAAFAFRRPRMTHFRGRSEAAYADVRRAVESERHRGDPGFCFAGIQVPSHHENHHTAYLGETRSGKTSLMLLQMQDVLPLVGVARDHRAIVVDGSSDVLAMLATLELRCTTYILNPFDARCTPYHVFADVTTRARAVELAGAIYPHRNESQPYFTNHARRIATAVVVTFVERGGERARFSDIARTLRTRSVLHHVLRLTHEGRAVLDEIAVSETFENVRSTITSELTPFEIVAALWEHAEEAGKKPISVREFLDDEAGSLLVLARPNESALTVNAVYSLVLKLLGQNILDLEPSPSRRIHVFLDELSQGGDEAAMRFPQLERLAREGAKRGVRIALTAGDLASLEETYGDKAANVILGLVPFKALLRTDSPSLAAFYEKVAGSADEVDPSDNQGPQGDTTTVFTKKTRPRFLADEFTSLPLADFERGISGIFVLPTRDGSRSVRHCVPADFLRSRIEPRSGANLNFMARPASHQILRDWCEADFERLPRMKLHEVARPVAARRGTGDSDPRQQKLNFPRRKRHP